MKYYVAKKDDGTAIIYTSYDSIKSTGLPFFETDNLPKGKGIFKTDLNTIWLEPYPTRQPDPETLLRNMIKTLSDRADFIEDCIAEMAGVVYNTEETT